MADGRVRYALVFQGEKAPAGALRPVALYASEGLSRPPRVELELLYEEGPLALEALCRSWAEVLVVRLDTGQLVRRFAGLVTRVGELAMRNREVLRARLTLESPLHLLSISSDLRLYQDKPTRDIVSEACAACGLPTDLLAWRLSGTYGKREVCTQWGETHLTFVSRLLEDEGIFYFVEYGESLRLVLGDAAASYTPLPLTPEVPFRASTGLLPEETITELREVARLRPATVTLREHDFRRPSLKLEGKAEAEAPFKREHYEYPVRFSAPEEGTRKAKARLEAFTAEASGVEGRGQVFRMTAGHTFRIVEGPAWTEREWVVREVVHRWQSPPGGEASYRTDFRLLPNDMPFRPLPRTAKPRAYGPQTAVVTGPPGEEIYCDEFGRVKVQFSFDRHGKQDDKSSSWVRVGQMHTSGSVAIPRIGWEVLVDFEDGDPDRPLVLGRAYNGANRPPTALPGAKTVSSLTSYSSPGGGGFNEIRTDDSAGAEAFSVHAQKDMNVAVANNRDESVTQASTVGVGADQGVDIGANHVVEVGSAEQVTVGGSQSHSVVATRSETVGSNLSLDVGASRSMSVGASHTLLTPLSVDCSVKGSLNETIGGSCVEAAALGVNLAVAGATSITVGGVKLEAVVAGKNDITLGARASTVGGALVNATPQDISTSTSASKVTTVGGAWLTSAGENAEFSSEAGLTINVGGAFLVNAAEVVLKVGDSTVSLSGGNVVIHTKEVKLTATGPNAELAPLASSK